METTLEDLIDDGNDETVLKCIFRSQRKESYLARRVRILRP